ncbi:S-layer homology domain-containing protein [Fortiea contorta]|uniref:S-layer homology domain-containing protein n=1 Tax=Fortiea contorta TaxID=1892405 RepID=UPI00034C52CD|nr:S-layer homology domain-containing protein [Fortiea contorta]
MKITRQLLGTILLTVLLQNFPGIVQSQQPEANADKLAEPIQKVTAAKLMSNSADGKFYPERLINRAELAAILVKTFRLEQRQAAQTQNSISVADVPASHWAYKDIQTVLKTDIMRGYRGNLFFPNQRITKAEALAIFAQAYGVFQFPDENVKEILAPYPDAASIPTWARRAIATIITEGFINTDAQGNISPLQPMTRGDMAYLLSKYLQRQKKQADTPEVPILPDAPEPR